MEDNRRFISRQVEKLQANKPNGKVKRTPGVDRLLLQAHRLFLCSYCSEDTRTLRFHC